MGGIAVSMYFPEVSCRGMKRACGRIDMLKYPTEGSAQAANQHSGDCGSNSCARTHISSPHRRAQEPAFTVTHNQISTGKFLEPTRPSQH